MKKSKDKYWYLYTRTLCYLCGYENEVKERIYNKPRPLGWEKRHIINNITNKCSCRINV